MKKLILLLSVLIFLIPSISYALGTNYISFKYGKDAWTIYTAGSFYLSNGNIVTNKPGDMYKNGSFYTKYTNTPNLFDINNAAYNTLTTNVNIYTDASLKLVFLLPNATSNPGNGTGGTTPGDSETWWDSAFSSIDEFWDSIGSFVNTAIGQAISILVSPLEHIGNALNSLAEGFRDSINSVIEEVKNIFNKIGLIVDYLNPLHENFFLKIAFVPDPAYFTTKFNSIYNTINSKFPVLAQMIDTVNSLYYFTDSEWRGIKIQVPFTNKEAYIISPDYINVYANKFKFWVSGIMYFFTSLFLIKQARTVLNS